MTVAVDPNEPNPDSWVPRNPSLWVHGKWNKETPIDLLENHGYVTPNDLYFVRSHAAVPIKHSANIENEHKLEIAGPYIRKPQTFSLRELKNKFKNVDLWSCLVCSGQRRLELNLIKKSAGHIDWHNATGNAKWTGVYLRDVLNHCGVDIDSARHVEFYGKDDYQTSIPFAKCIDVSGDTLLAWSMNDQELPFDHGYPLRVVVPGWSSKCSAKWIHKITVQEKETEAHMYHRYYKWFAKSIVSVTKQLDEVMATPAVTELNTNAVAFRPRNGTKAESGPLKVNGYCYTGGGRPVSRVEISTDDGNTWIVTNKVREELTKHGRCYAWVLWEYTIPDFNPATHKEIIVRAFDISAQGMTPQPEWNLTGMMNNTYFRIKVANIGGQYVFQHPTTWMDPEKANAPIQLAPVFEWKGDCKVLNGAWSMGDNVPPITLSVDTNGNFQSQEQLYGGEPVKGHFSDLQKGEVWAKFGPFFEVGGTIDQGGIRWNNGAKWSKL